MATKSAKMNQLRRKSGPRSTQQAHPPRGEEVSGSLIIAKAIIKLLVVQIYQEYQYARSVHALVPRGTVVDNFN